MRAHAYGLLRAMLKTAAADDLIAASPCRIRGAGQAKRARRIQARDPRRAGGDRGGHARPATG